MPEGEGFWRQVEADPAEVRQTLASRYPLVPRPYVEYVLEIMVREHPGNPLAPLYLEAELGAVGRQLDLIRELEAHGLSLQGARCLDIGCSNGSLLLAARQAGAQRLVGVDVHPRRIDSARRLCQGSGIELEVRDLLAGDPGNGLGPFDVVFATDVIEHVASAELLFQALKALLAHRPEAFVFISVFNGRHPSCIMKEPHYGIPGMVLLPREEAEALWLGLRDRLKSNLDYEVSHWYPYPEIKHLAETHGFTVQPFVDPAFVLQERQTFWTGYHDRLAQLRESLRADIDRLEVSAEWRERLRAGFEGYAEDFLRDHQDFEARRGEAPDEAILDFHLTYYTQPIRLVLRHASSI